MKTTLKRGMGRGLVLNGSGRPVFPPGVRTPMTRYRQPDPPRRSPWRMIRLALAWVLLAVLIVTGGAAGAAFLKQHEFFSAIAPHSKTDKETQKHLVVASPNQPSIALLIGTDKRLGSDARFTGPVGRSDTLMLLRADPKTDTISMLSLPRDMIVPIHCPGRLVYENRINAAFAECGSLGSLLTVQALTHLPINYFITVNFHGFKDLVDQLGGVWMDVDHRYFNNHTGPGGYSAINLWPGYQRLDGDAALSYVRYRHFDSDLYRVARQQLFLKAVKQQITSSLSFSSLLDVASTVEKNVIVGRGGSQGLDLPTLRGYLQFAQNLPGGHIFQSRIEGLTGYAELHTDPSNITAAVSDFLHPDVSAPAKARDVTLRIKRRSHALKPSHVTVTVLNGNGVPGSAANAAYELNLRGYRIVLPPSQKPQNAPNYDYINTTVYYDASQRGAKAAASQLANLFPSAVAKMTDIQIAALANGAMATVVVGKDFTGQIAPPPTANIPKPQPPAVTANASATLPYLRGARKRVHFRLEVPYLLANGSEPEPLAPIRIYGIAKGHVAVRLSFEQGQIDYWGIEETDWSDAPILNSPSFEHVLGGRTFDFYYSGAHLHMIVLKENGATYWVMNTILDSLSNETMLAIAKGLRPLGGR
jgi:LCP family protein required for cell wall assembly